MDPHRFERIRLVSSRFRELQGLRVALAGASIAVVLGSYLIATPQPTQFGATVALSASFALMLPGVLWLDRYYATTFGRQVKNPRERWPTLAFLLMFWTLSAWLVPLLAAAVMVGVMSLWVAVRDWPWRGYYLAATAAVATSFIAALSSAGAEQPGVALAMTYFLFGLAFVPIGLLDHRLLVKLMQKDTRSA